MRVFLVLLAIGASMVTQSCRIEMPSSLHMVSNYFSYNPERMAPYDFRESVALRLQDFADTLVVGDRFETRHGQYMRRNILQIGVPEEHLVFLPRFLTPNFGYGNGNWGLEDLVSGTMETVRKAARVVHIPRLAPLRNRLDIPHVEMENILFVLSAGNMHEYYSGDRNLYNPEHIFFRETITRHADEGYEEVVAFHNTGKVLVATSARMVDENTVAPLEYVVSCGDVQEACFTVTPRQSTSAASSRLAAIAFYLSQFWDTPEEVVEVLGACALDVGDPGIDREYGRGVVNLLCPPVLKKELEVVSSYVSDQPYRGEDSQGGLLRGVWEAKNTSLVMHLPQVLQETLSLSAVGTVEGAVTFSDTEVVADFSSEASVSAFFLMDIEATAEEVVQAQGEYGAVDATLRLPGDTRPFMYTATGDSLHLVRSYSLNEALALLPNPLGSMVDMASEDFFTDDPIQIRMSFVRTSALLVADFNGDDAVDFADFLLFIDAFGSFEGDTAFSREMDLVPDGVINFNDFLVFVEHFGAADG